MNVLRRYGVVGLIVLLGAASRHAQTVNKKPDLIPMKNMLYDNLHWYTGSDTYLRLSNAVANVGVWELFFEPTGSVLQDGTRAARQRWRRIVNGVPEYVYDDVGYFEFHEATCHNHIHLGEIAEYQLREYISATEAGDPVATSEKVGFCLRDNAEYDPETPLTGQPENAVFEDCPWSISGSFEEGISIGWRDEYRLDLTDQWVLVPSSTPAGAYYLQSTVDPSEIYTQATRANDVERIPVFITYKDRFEANDSKSAVDNMGLGGKYSSNLGRCATVLDSLSIHREYIPAEPPGECFGGDRVPDVDYFKFQLYATGGAGDSVEIYFGDSSSTDFKDGNLDIELLDANGSTLTTSATSNNYEKISLSGRTAGAYYVKVYGRTIVGSGQHQMWNSNYYYRLEIERPMSWSLECGDMNGDGSVNQADIIILAGCCDGECAGQICDHKRDMDGDCETTCDPDLDVLIDYVLYNEPLPQFACNCFLP